MVFALKGIFPTKAPGLDGFHALFYQRFWKIIGADILGILNGDVAIKNTNEIVLVLIPKVKHPEWISKFQPISLCNVVYKLISKVLTNQIQQVLPSLIDQVVVLSGSVLLWIMQF